MDGLRENKLAAIFHFWVSLNYPLNFALNGKYLEIVRAAGVWCQVGSSWPGSSNIWTLLYAASQKSGYVKCDSVNGIRHAEMTHLTSYIHNINN